jgi:hypothetical protein
MKAIKKAHSLYKMLIMKALELLSIKSPTIIPFRTRLKKAISHPKELMEKKN